MEPDKERRSKVMTQERLEKLLRSLPALDEPCRGEEGCDHKAVLRDPGVGVYLCADCAINRAKCHAFYKKCIEIVVRQRRFFLANPTECTDCKEAAWRWCSYCEAPLCYECPVLIPSNGCACSTCSATMEEEAATLWGDEESWEDDDKDDVRYG